MKLCKAISVLIACSFLLIACTNTVSDFPTTQQMAGDKQDTRSQDEILAELFAQTDGPVVVQLIGRSPYLFQDDLAPIWNAPHVINVIGTSYVHWLDDSEDASLTMIGQYDVDLDPAAVVEGRWYETDTECCVNRAEYERLLADPESGFSELGDTVTYTEPEKTLSAGSFVKPKEPVSRQFVVVGVVADSAPYDNTNAYAIYHVYTTVDGVTAMMANYTNNVTYYFSDVDLRAYWNARIVKTQNGSAVYKEDPDREGYVLFRCADDRIYSEEEWLEQYSDTVSNAGYTVEVTLDSGKNYADFVEYLRITQFTEEPASERLHILEEMRENALKNYEKNWLTPKYTVDGTPIVISDEIMNKAKLNLEETLATLEPDATTAYLQEIGELDEWFRCNGNVPYVVRPLRVEE